MLLNVVVCLVIFPLTAFASTLYVGLGETHTTIQSAIDTATDGDIIIVRDGTYTENVDVNKSVILIGGNLENTIVVGGFKITADNVTIDHFTINGGYEWGANKAGIYVESCNNVQIINNRIGNIQGQSGAAGKPYSGSGGTGGVGAGIYLSFLTGSSLTSNTIENIRGGTGGAGATGNGSGGAGGVGSGIYLSSSTGNNLTSNTIQNIQGGIGGAGYGPSSSKGADQMGFGIYLDGNSENNYLGVSEPEFNAFDGDPILYFYNMTALVIENYTLTANSNPTNYGKIVFINCANFTVRNNIIRSYVGMSGGTSGLRSSAGIGGMGIGIYLSGSTGNSLTSNTITNIQGGTGGAGGYEGSGGTGDVGAGIYLSSSTGNSLTSNAIANIQGGTGGAGGYEGSGGTGGMGAGIYMSSSTGNSLTANAIEGIQGGIGGAGHIGSEGADQVGFGIYLDGSSQSNYLGISASEFNTLDGDPVLYFYNTTGLVIENHTLIALSNPTNYGKIVLINCTNFTIQNNIIRNYVGMSGTTGGWEGSGGNGGMGTGIYLSSSIVDNLNSNTIENIQGGTGGTGGTFHGSGGTGGISAGIYLSSSTADNMNSNTIETIQGGIGGNGAHWGAGGFGSMGAGIFLFSSPGNNPTSNTMDNIQGGAGGNGGHYGSEGIGGVGYDIWRAGEIYDGLVVDDDWKEKGYGEVVLGNYAIGENAFGSIQQAIAVAKPNATILVYPGTYVENLKVDKENLTVRSESGTAVTIVQALISRDHVFEVKAGGVSIIGFMVENATENGVAGIFLSGSDNCSISNNTCSNNYHGIYLASSSDNNIDSNTCENNDYSGIFTKGSSGNTLTNNTCTNNKHGIYLYSASDNNTISNNLTANNDYGIRLYGSNNNLTNNICNNLIVARNLIHFL